MSGPDKPTRKRWREAALRAQREIALDRPLPPEHEIRLTISLLATYLLCLTVDVCDRDEVDRHWGML